MRYPLLRPIANRIRAIQTPLLHRLVVRPSSRPIWASDAGALVLAPHADDETFGCGGMIAMKRQAGAAVSIAVLTDGSQSDPQGSGNESDLVANRRKEITQAASILGVSPDHLHFFDAPDGRLADLAEDSRIRLVDRICELIVSSGVTEVYVPHRHDRHPDHEATFRLAVEALRSPGALATRRPLALMEYLVWLVWKRPVLLLSLGELRGAGRLNTAAVQTTKNQAIAVYRSQLPSMPPGFLPQFQRGEEYFWRTIYVDHSADAGWTG